MDASVFVFLIAAHQHINPTDIIFRMRETVTLVDAPMFVCSGVLRPSDDAPVSITLDLIDVGAVIERPQ